MDNKTVFGKAGCHMVNLGELLEELDVEFGNDETGKIVIPVDKLLKLAGLVWAKLQETFRECEGKELQIDFGDSVAANTAESLMGLLLGFLAPKDDKTPE